MEGAPSCHVGASDAALSDLQCGIDFDGLCLGDNDVHLFTPKLSRMIIA